MRIGILAGLLAIVGWMPAAHDVAPVTLPVVQDVTPAVNTDHIKHPEFRPQTAIRITEAILLHEVRDFVLDGRGATIFYEGPKRRAIVELGSALNCTVKHLRIVDLTGCDHAVLITNLPGKVGSSGCLIDDVFVRYGNGEPGPRIAFGIDSLIAGGVDRNNDLHTLNRCGSNNHSEAGVYLRGTQVHQILISQGNFGDYGHRRPYGILAEKSGYFTVRDSSFWNNSCDVHVAGPSTRITLQGINSEHSTQLFRSDRVGAPTFTRIVDVRWDGEPQPGTPVIDFWGDGPFECCNGFLRGLNGVVPLIRCAAGRGRDGRINPGSIRLENWWTMCHALVRPEGPDVIVPGTWAYQQFGSRFLLVDDSDWPREILRVNRTW